MTRKKCAKNKVRSVIRAQESGYPVSTKHIEQCLRDTESRRVLRRLQLDEPAETVDHDDDVFIAIRITWNGAHDVDRSLCERLLHHSRSKCGGHTALAKPHFLTDGTAVDEPLDILFHRRPVGVVALGGQ